MRKQRGSITLLGVSSIVVSLFAFTQVTEFANAKILDRELDNYAREVASVALRSELSITKAMIDEGKTGITSTTVSNILRTIGMTLPDPSDDSIAFNLERKITFGKFKADGSFESCEDYKVACKDSC
ncbi:MAG: hypothetical protein PF450_13125, partial [Bacteroidales bacterium]|nr:hypothetical protein [Bacteroidales bacterium]